MFTEQFAKEIRHAAESLIARMAQVDAYVQQLEADNARLREALASLGQLLETLSTPDDAIINAAFRLIDGALQS